MNFIKKILKLFHIHRYEIKGLFYEQLTDYVSDDKLVYCDVKKIKCKCGKSKNVIIAIYTASNSIQYTSSGIGLVVLGNKKTIL